MLWDSKKLAAVVTGQEKTVAIVCSLTSNYLPEEAGVQNGPLR